MKKFSTLSEIIEHLQGVKAKMDAFKAENPDIEFSTYRISNLQPALLYELHDHIGDYYSRQQVEYSNNLLHLFNYRTFGFAVAFYSLPVEMKQPTLDMLFVTQEEAV